jgi:hypothetical protein
MEKEKERPIRFGGFIVPLIVFIESSIYIIGYSDIDIVSR